MKIGGAWEVSKLTEENIFTAFIEMLGFKEVKRVPDDFKKQFLREADDEVVCYTLSGGPIVIFTNTGNFQEWA